MLIKDEVQDTITGFKGVVIAKTIWENGCIRYGVQSKEMKDGKPISSEWFDEQRLVVTKTTSVAAVDESKSVRGGPQDDPVMPSGE